MTFAADYAGAIVVEAKRYGRDQLNVPLAWGLHTPEEPADATPSTPWYFHNNDVGSTTYFVAWTGLIFQCVPENRRAYANPRNKGTPFAWENPNKPLDQQTLSIEIEGDAATIHLTMPRGSPQWVALVRLMADRCVAKGFPPERSFGHYEVSTQRSDPGQLDIAALVSDVRALMEWSDMPTIDEIKQAMREVRDEPIAEYQGRNEAKFHNDSDDYTANSARPAAIYVPPNPQQWYIEGGKRHRIENETHLSALVKAGVVRLGGPVAVTAAERDAIPEA